MDALACNYSLKPTLMTALASTMMIVVCAAVIIALAAVAPMRMQRTTTQQQRLKMGLVCTVKKLSTHWLNHWNVLLVRIQTSRTSADGYIGVDDILACCRFTTHLVRNKPTTKDTE